VTIGRVKYTAHGVSTPR